MAYSVEKHPLNVMSKADSLVSVGNGRFRHDGTTGQ